MAPTDGWYQKDRLGGLRRFAASLTVFNLVGHTLLGFEQSWAQPIVAVLAAYAVELGLEVVDAHARRRPYLFAGGPRRLVDFLLSAHITGLAVAMLLYANDRLAVVAFAAAAAVASKVLVRAPVNGASRHVFNPSNLGITLTLLLFPWVGIAPPYHFTENLGPVGDWALPAFIVVTGSFINARFTHRVPVILAWVAGFALQAAVRSWAFGTPVAAALGPMTGVAFVLFTFYMLTDPATTPGERTGQVAFGAGVALAYGALVAAHIVFGFFFALTIVCTVRALTLWSVALLTGRRAAAPVAALRAEPAAAAPVGADFYRAPRAGAVGGG